MNNPVGGGSPGAGMGRKTIALVMVAIVVVALVGIAVTIVLVTGQGGSSPNGKVKDYLHSVESKDSGSAFNTTIWGLNQSLYPDWNDLIDFGSTNYSIKINSLVEVPRSDLSVEQMHEMNDSIETIQELFGVVVEDYSIVEVNITVTATDNGESDTYNNTAEIPLVKIGGKWLIVEMLEDLEDILKPNEPVTPAATLVRATITRGVKITIISITQPSVPWDNMHFILSDGVDFAAWSPNSADLQGGTAITMNYSAQPLGPINVCCTVTDLAGNGGINGGDYILFFTFGGAATFSTGITYTVTLVYVPTGDIMSTITFTG